MCGRKRGALSQSGRRKRDRSIGERKKDGGGKERRPTKVQKNPLYGPPVVLPSFLSLELKIVEKEGKERKGRGI